MDTKLGSGGMDHLPDADFTLKRLNSYNNEIACYPINKEEHVRIQELEQLFAISDVTYSFVVVF